MQASQKSNFWLGLGALVVILAVLGIVGLGAYRAFFLTSTQNYHLVYTYDRLQGGKIEIVPHQGYVFAWPVVKSVYTIDTRPFQTCLSANKRVMNCKLVNFDAKSEEGLREFLSWHGLGDYDINDVNFQEIMKSYAFDQTGKRYSFLVVGQTTGGPAQVASGPTP